MLLIVNFSSVFVKSVKLKFFIGVLIFMLRKIVGMLILIFVKIELFKFKILIKEFFKICVNRKFVLNAVAVL